MSINGNSFCLDPSCFTSLSTLKDTLKVVEEVCKDDYELYVPTEVLDTIMLQPEEKFRKLPTIINEWFESNEKDITKLNQTERKEYVKVMRLLFRYNLIPIIKRIENIEKIGDDSIHRKDLLKKLGSIPGRILFETLAISSKLKTRIISFGRKTINLVRKTGSSVLEFSSNLKRTIKEKKGIKTALSLSIFLIGASSITAMFTGLPLIAGFLTIPEMANLGLLVVGNG